jgi:hypothetical protein
MAVAVWTVHAPKGFFIDDGGYEYATIVAVASASTGSTSSVTITWWW